MGVDVQRVVLAEQQAQSFAQVLQTNSMMHCGRLFIWGIAIRATELDLLLIYLHGDVDESGMLVTDAMFECVLNHDNKEQGRKLNLFERLLLW